MISGGQCYHYRTYVPTILSIRLRRRHGSCRNWRSNICNVHNRHRIRLQLDLSGKTQNRCLWQRIDLRSVQPTRIRVSQVIRQRIFSPVYPIRLERRSWYGYVNRVHRAVGKYDLLNAACIAESPCANIRDIIIYIRCNKAKLFILKVALCEIDLVVTAVCVKQIA
ncbi:hypothetical protein D3C71_1629850 [compost metagenome]